MNIESRLQKLERIEGSEDPTAPACLVIYDHVSGQPLAPIDWRAEVRVWLPHNYRDDPPAR